MWLAPTSRSGFSSVTQSASRWPSGPKVTGPVKIAVFLAASQRHLNGLAAGMGWDAGMVAIAILMLASGLIMSRQEQSRTA